MECGTAGSGTGGSKRAPLRFAPGWVTEALARLRADLSRPAMDRRILHRLNVIIDRELRAIGFVRRDVHDARAPDAGDVAAFLVARREARHALRRRLCGGAVRASGYHDGKDDRI